MNELGSEPTFRAYALILRRRKWWVVSLAVLGLAISLAFSLTAKKQYSATAQLLVQPSAAASGVGAVQQPVTPTQVQTELQLVTSAPVQQAVRGTLHSTPAVSVAEVAQTNVIAITATSPVPSRAAVIANLYATSFVQYRQAVAERNLAGAEDQLRSQIYALGKELRPFKSDTTSPVASALLNQQAVLKEQLAQMQVSGAVNPSDVVLVTPAQAPVSPSSPKPVQDALLGLAAGLALGLAAAFLRDSVDDRLGSKEATESASGTPVLALTPVVTTWRRQGPVVVSVSEPTSPAAESYRSLRTSLQFARQERQLRSLMVTSPGVGEGKTSTLANLGVVFAQAGERILLVSADLRRPQIGGFFHMEERVGLTSVLLGQRTLEESVRPVSGIEHLSLLPSGPVPSNPAELLNSSRAQDLFESLRERYDLVLIDTPPVLPVTDAAILARYADATLLLAAAGQTRRGDLRRAAEKLSQVNADILGTVLNKVTRQTGRNYGYSYTYAYSYAYKPDKARESFIAPAAHPNGSGGVLDHNPR